MHSMEKPSEFTSPCGLFRDHRPMWIPPQIALISTRNNLKEIVMGTRARIAIQQPNGSYKSIYTHWDGYPSHHGAILVEHYQDPKKVKALIALGNLSSLAEQIGEKHDFDQAPEGVCNAYGRDRGEDGCRPCVSKTLATLSALTQECGGEYLYVFQDGKWFVAEGGIAFFGNPASEAPGALRLVSEVLAEEKAAA